MRRKKGAWTPKAVCDCSALQSIADKEFANRDQNFGKRTVKQSEFFQRRQDRAHRRYLSAIRTLAQVRRLLLPPVQVNIGAQQVNAMQVVAESRREP